MSKDTKKLSLKEIGLPKLILLGVLGVVLLLLCIPDLFGGKKEPITTKTPTLNSTPVVTGSITMTEDYVAEMETKLKHVLSQVANIGKVEVMITLKKSKEQIVLKDTPYTKESLIEDDGEGGKREDQSISSEENTIMVADKYGNAVPYILQEIEPEVEGIVVIAEGGDNAKIAADVTELAEVLFRVPAHKVKVMKMK